MTRLAIAIATFFGCGFFPKGPGTVGSLAAIGTVLLLQSAGFGRPALLAISLILFPVAVWAATLTAKAFGRKDPGEVVVDEVLGQWVALLGASIWNWQSYLAGFLLFRLFDIWKPQPVRRAESL